MFHIYLINIPIEWINNKNCKIVSIPNLSLLLSALKQNNCFALLPLHYTSHGFQEGPLWSLATSLPPLQIPLTITKLLSSWDLILGKDISSYLFRHKIPPSAFGHPCHHTMGHRSSKHASGMLSLVPL